MFSRSRITHVVWIAAVATALAVQTATVHAQPADTPWPMWGQNAQRTSVGLEVPSKNDLMWVAGYQSGAEVAIGKKAIYVAGSGLQAMNFDGTLRWTCPIGSTDQCCPAISQDEDGHEVIYLYGISYEDGGGRAGFFAVDENAPSAHVDLYNPLPDYFFPKCLVKGFRWSCPTREIQSRAAIAADGSIFVTSFAGGTPSGFLYKFTPQLAVAWQFPLPKGSPDNGPAIGPDGTIYACAADNYLYAVTSAGTLKWKYKLTNFGRSPVVGNPSDGGYRGVAAIRDDATAQPSVYYIEPRPNPVAVGEDFRLYAAGVNAAVNPIAQVDFYLDDGDGQFDPDDSLLGTATASTPESPYVWPLDVTASTLLPASHTVFAVATESFTGRKSNVVSRIVTQE